ncbi:MAG: methyltransferase domain-containing protein [Acetobacteraceae bacterium]|nr:methyltransferase domain-containing protein [Acetobacteraceae bacterium]
MNAPMPAPPRAHSDPTREIAFDLLSAVLDRRRTLEDALDRAGGAEPRDRAAAHRLAAAVLRRMGSLDAVLEPFLNRAPPETVRHVLRIGAAGLLLLETPPHAAVATAVALARSRKLAPFAGLVNAVLRRVAEAGPAVLDELDGPRLDTPAWLWTSWGRDARAIAEAHAHEAPLDLTLARGAVPAGGGSRLPTGSIRFPPGTRVPELPGYAEGHFWVQDAAAALPARLLAPQAGEQVADLCAAPGGKTAQLAASGAQVVAVERDPARIRRLHENLARLNLQVDVVQADATEWRPAAPIDAVLLDAPCSATGTIRRHPDVLRLRRPRDVAELASAQDRMLEAAAAMLRPSGRLIYAVCSLQPEEGPQRVAHPERFGLQLDPFTPEELATIPEARTASGHLRTHPGMWPEWGGLDGFFAARLVRT